MSVMKSCSSWKYMMLNMCKNNRSGEKKKKKPSRALILSCSEASLKTGNSMIMKTGMKRAESKLFFFS